MDINLDINSIRMKAADRSRITIIVPISLARISLLILARAVSVLLLGT